MTIELPYGRGHLPVNFPESCTEVIEPTHVPGMTDERAAVINALEHPIGATPLRQWIKPDDKVCITFSDITRPTPNERLIPWLLDYLPFVPRENILLVNQLGTHRPNTAEELDRMLTPAVARNYRIVNHEPENPAELVEVGRTRNGNPALINRHVVEADARIVTGFIEPHFFAGFSGGPKGIMPGTAALETVLNNHRATNIAHPNATFGVMEGNPLWEELRDIALRVGPSFLLNVTLNNYRAITNVFAGDLVAAHWAGTEFVRRSAMRRIEKKFDIVVTTNSGYPLDLNLYQGVKGLSAGARIVKPGGLLILACECSEGVPTGSPMDSLLRQNPETLLKTLRESSVTQPEQWQAQILLQILKTCRVRIHSSIPEKIIRELHLTPGDDIEKLVAEEMRAIGPEAEIAVLPYGPLTIPYH